MKSITVSVKDEDYSRLKETLQNLNDVEKLEESFTDTYSLLSQESLAEEWLSDEDDRYDLTGDK